LVHIRKAALFSLSDRQLVIDMLVEVRVDLMVFVTFIFWEIRKALVYFRKCVNNEVAELASLLMINLIIF
jgi:hypothetical protein